MVDGFIKELKKEGWKQKEIAAKCGLTPQFISLLADGANCSLETALRLADAFNAPLDKVVGRKNPEKTISATEELLLKATAGDEDLARIALRSVEGEKLVTKMSEDRRVAAA